MPSRIWQHDRYGKDRNQYGYEAGVCGYRAVGILGFGLLQDVNGCHPLHSFSRLPFGYPLIFSR